MTGHEPSWRFIRRHWIPICDSIRNGHVFGVNENVHALKNPTFSSWRVDASSIAHFRFIHPHMCKDNRAPIAQNTDVRQLPGVAIFCVIWPALDEFNWRRFLRIRVQCNCQHSVLLQESHGSLKWNFIAEKGNQAHLNRQTRFEHWRCGRPTYTQKCILHTNVYSVYVFRGRTIVMRSVHIAPDVQKVRNGFETIHLSIDGSKPSISSLMLRNHPSLRWFFHLRLEIRWNRPFCALKISLTLLTILDAVDLYSPSKPPIISKKSPASDIKSKGN